MRGGAWEGRGEPPPSLLARSPGLLPAHAASRSLNAGSSRRDRPWRHRSCSPPRGGGTCSPDGCRHARCRCRRRCAGRLPHAAQHPAGQGAGCGRGHWRAGAAGQPGAGRGLPPRGRRGRGDWRLPGGRASHWGPSHACAHGGALHATCVVDLRLPSPHAASARPTEAGRGWPAAAGGACGRADGCCQRPGGRAAQVRLQWGRNCVLRRCAARDGQPLRSAHTSRLRSPTCPPAPPPLTPTHSPYQHHFKLVSEAMQALSWVAYTGPNCGGWRLHRRRIAPGLGAGGATERRRRCLPTGPLRPAVACIPAAGLRLPALHVEDAASAADFYANKVGGAEGIVRTGHAALPHLLAARC